MFYFEELPAEIASRIAWFLDKLALSSLSQASRFWSIITRQHLFHTITLDCSQKGTEVWTNIIESKELRRLPRTVIVKGPRLHIDYKYEYDAPGYDYTANMVTYILETYKDRKYWFPPDVNDLLLGFVARLDDLCRLDHIEHVNCIFEKIPHSDRTRDGGKAVDRHGHCHVVTLKLVVYAIRRRRIERGNLTPIRKFTVKNLVDDTISRSVVGEDPPILAGIEHLGLLINDDNEAWHPFRKEPYSVDCLRERWDLPIAEQLKHLSVFFEESGIAIFKNIAPSWNYCTIFGLIFPS